MPKKQLIGTIISNKMEKTLTVEVERMKVHPKYKRRYKAHKKYKVHNEKGEYALGDKVLIEICRPFSKDKCWIVVKKISSQGAEDSTPAQQST